MFREMLRKKQQLSKEECEDILRQQMRGVLSVLGDDDYPYGMPLNHYYAEDGCLYFHGGKVGHKIDAFKRYDKASFCVYDEGFRNEGEWFLNIRSVIVFGRIEIVEDEETVKEIARRISLKFTDDEGYITEEIRKDLKGTLMFRLMPEHMTGKIVREK
ncbi:MAG: pyridoxamine 5'-phosphate oxidase family protein [Erysipelotrichaceae bacterium]|nr:pyridoxamine 5'-phosphate oxidase family protein [Erysipelotrichaceae bacterium]